MIDELVLKTRSYRRFDQQHPVSMQTLRELIDLARLSPSGSNLQPLKFVPVCDPEKNARVFASLHWARRITGWAGPAEGERPAAYIVILGDKEIATDFGVDHGIAAHSIVLGAMDRGLGACILGSAEHDVLRPALSIPDRYEILLVVALGKPGETVVVESAGPEGNVGYWRDAQGVHHVPKRDLDDVILAL